MCGDFTAFGVYSVLSRVGHADVIGCKIESWWCSCSWRFWAQVCHHGTRKVGSVQIPELRPQNSPTHKHPKKPKQKIKPDLPSYSLDLGMTWWPITDWPRATSCWEGRGICFLIGGFVSNGSENIFVTNNVHNYWSLIFYLLCQYVTIKTHSCDWSVLSLKHFISLNYFTMLDKSDQFNSWTLGSWS